MKAIQSTETPLKGAQVWPLSVAAYHALGESGLIPTNTELLYGIVYHKMSKSPFHSFLLQVLQEILLRTVRPGYTVRIAQPITCLDSEPEPDLAVVKGLKEDFRNHHPHTAELVIEICVSSHEYDRAKLHAYARAGVKECWLVLGPEKRIEVHRRPGSDQFAERLVHDSGAPLVSAAVPEFAVELDALFAN